MRNLFALLLFCLYSPVIMACSCDCVFNEMTLCRFLHEGADHFVEAKLIQKDSTLDGYLKSWQFELINDIADSGIYQDTFWIGTKDEEVEFGCYSWFPNSFETATSLNDTIFLNANIASLDNIHLLKYCQEASFHLKNNYITGSLYFNYFTYDQGYEAFKKYLKVDYFNDYECVECSCFGCSWDLWPQFDFSSFCSSFKKTQGFSGVGRFEILAKDEYSLTVSSIETFNTWTLPSGPLKIWGKRKEDDCRRTLEDFEVGKEYIIRVFQMNVYNRIHPDEIAGDLELKDCGIIHLRVENELVIGPINEYHFSMSYEEFKEPFESIEFYYSDDCGWWLVGEESIENLDLLVYPNPCKDYVNIRTNLIVESIQLININGKSHQVESIANQIDLSHLPNGIYFLRMLIAGQEITKKLIMLN